MIHRGEAAFWRTNLALFSAGLATFALLYAVQPLLPVFAMAFGRGAAGASLVLSGTTAALAISLLAASAVADALGRKKVMVAAMLSSAVLCMACAASPGYLTLLLLRAAMGLTLSGLPAVAMAYVAEEMAPGAAGLAIGLYIGGSAIGGMTGRLLAAAVSDAWGWRAALLAVGALGLACGAALWLALPASRHFTPQPPRPRRLAAALAGQWRIVSQRRLFALAFLLMGGFVSTYNYIGFRLLAPPYSLRQGSVGLIFSVYLVGVVSSTVMGGAGRRLGRARVIGGNLALMAAGLALTLAAPVWLIVIGVAAITAGFFGAHAVASAWVAEAGGATRAQARALYLFCYYAGSSVVGSLAGLAWTHAAWPGVAAVIGLCIVAALASSPKWATP